MLSFSEEGFQVTGFDIDPRKVAMLNEGRSYIEHILPEQIARARTRGFEATGDYSRIRDMDAILLAVPTPLDQHREPDMTYVLGTVESILPHLREKQLVSLESTTYPGTTREVLQPRIESRGLKVGKDIYLAFSPERVDPGNEKFTFRQIPKVCGGITPSCLEAALALYGAIVDRVVPVTSPEAAEMTKLMENIHRAVNIGLVNELKILCDRMKLDIFEIIRASSTKPFGFTPYYPGPGLGGHCIPIDPFYLTWRARKFGVNTRFIELAGEINSAMPTWVISKVIEALNARSKSVKGSKICILGVAYKKNIDDVRESPALEIVEHLTDLGAQVTFSDPHVPKLHKMRKYDFSHLASQELSASFLKTQDCLVLVTDHEQFNYRMIRETAWLIVDTRGVYPESYENVVRA
jgi:UDP-N-acetyl-D-glucosamine dehydrogenase